MLKLQPNPTFTAKVGIPVPGGEAVEVSLTFKHMTRAELEQFLTGQDAAKRPDLETVMAIVQGWDGVDAPFSRQSVEAVLSQYHAFARTVVGAWVNELTQARLGN
jgi:hypothetical protein